VHSLGNGSFTLERRACACQRQRIEQAKHRAGHARRSITRCCAVDGLIKAIPGVDDTGQHQQSFTTGHEQRQRTETVDPLHDRFDDGTQVVPVDLRIVTNGFDTGPGGLLHGQYQLGKWIGA